MCLIFQNDSTGSQSEVSDTSHERRPLGEVTCYKVVRQ